MIPSSIRNHRVRAGPLTPPPAVASVPLAITIGAALGSLVVLSWPLAVALAGSVIALVLLWRVENKAAAFVALYWLMFALKSTIFADVQIPGLFYPFYLGFVASLAWTLARGGIEVQPTVLWLLFGFLFVVATSFVGFMSPIGQPVIQRLIAIVVCPLVFLQFRSRQGLDWVAGAGTLSALVVAAWVIGSAAEGGFEYRGDVEANENIVAFVVGLGMMVTAGRAVAAITRAPSRWTGIGLLVLTGVIGYAFLLLSSRGMAIAAVVSLAALVVQLVVHNRRHLIAGILLMLLLPLGLLLPGGDGLIERFRGESVESAGDRTPIWRATVEEYLDGSVRQILFGSGFDSSKEVVRRATGSHTSTHNAYLSTIYEFGVVGLVLFLALHVVVLLLAVRSALTYGAMAVGVTWYLLGSGLTATTPDDFMYWLALGYALALGVWGTVSTRRGLQGSSAPEPTR